MKLSYQTYDDVKLLELTAKNDEAAFSEIYNRYSAEMFLAAFNILRHKAGAEDAVQEVFISLWNRRDKLDIKHLERYLVRSVRYFVLRVYKEEKRDSQFYDRLALVTSDILQEDPVIFRDIQQTLQRIVSDLPNDQQTIFQLNREENMTYSDIAKCLNISVKTVEKKMSRSLKFIRPQINNLIAVGICLLSGF